MCKKHLGGLLLPSKIRLNFNTSVSILTELAKKPREEFRRDDNEIASVLKRMNRAATVNANLITTEDKHLL